VSRSCLPHHSLPVRRTCSWVEERVSVVNGWKVVSCSGESIGRKKDRREEEEKEKKLGGIRKKGKKRLLGKSRSENGNSYNEKLSAYIYIYIYIYTHMYFHKPVIH